MMALTATATPRVRTDILFQLKMNNPKWFLSSFNRDHIGFMTSVSTNLFHTSIIVSKEVTKWGGGGGVKQLRGNIK